ncbi:gene transfer agent [Roseibium sp. TrichSKD4]|uniref:DUF3168 domain-containing protein n=1 Tax=Roseibium sp. TrichSKD4 TaxID=744980 RepID=UPI0001E56B8C|nr:DUF3168 domain-containing protein [Roseibium sp. TrichSKD4]EFO32617.1 gene transfer agent [Roseibium sp. TrichSKD4]
MDATYELVAALIAHMKADAAVSGMVADRIYERPPDTPPTYPYISFGPTDAVTVDAECIDALEIGFQIDCYSNGSGAAFSRQEVMELAGSVRRALHEAEIDLPTNALALLRHRLHRTFRERDGVTNRAVLTFEAVIETGDT